ncbi:MAG: AAA family ATPase [Capsulimonadaceae bacterium]
MIPVRLELKNFMSYGDDLTVLDFEGMHTICLSGENGNGKSALLDAITWSLWGESRAGKNRHDDLVRIGADEMSVQFSFLMDGVQYRVQRKRSKRASGNQWELHQELPGGGWRSLTGNNAGETEKSILKLLRMSYDTFLNSAYLRQGQADQFVKQPAGKRKEILADILDLSRYDRLEVKARERAREAGAEAVDIEREINVIDAELAAEEGYRTSLAGLQSTLTDLQARQAEVAAELDIISKEIGELEGRKSFADEIRRQVAQAERECGELRRRIAEHCKEEDSQSALLDQAAAIEQGYADLLASREEMARLDGELRRYHKGRSVVAAVESEYAFKQNEAKGLLDRLTAEIEAAENKLVDQKRLREQRAEVKARLDRWDKDIAARQQLEVDRKVVADRLRKLDQHNTTLIAQIDAWTQRINSVRDQDGLCPVCNSPLPPDRIAALRTEYEAARQQCRDDRLRIMADGRIVKADLVALDSKINAFAAGQAAALQERVVFGQIEQRLKDAQEIQERLPEMRKQASDARRTLIAEEFAPDVRQRRDRFREELAKIEKVPEEHARMRTRIAELEPNERRHLQLGHAREALDAASARRRQAEADLAARDLARTEAAARVAEIADVGADLAAAAKRRGERQAALTRFQTEERAAALDIGRFQQRIERCESLKGERTTKGQRLVALRRDHEAYDQLSRAFGKKGVQALIIENAIPEIIEEANRLLDRLTDGDMSITFETLRESRIKREGPIETLDIKVSDNLGTRTLEMYSGGESFRAAFALRLALSKLLARRAGARLQTLIVDEGFGTQDGKGREKLVESLNAIKEDFEKIIVITHIDELKDAFATRIEVTKTPRGSQITVMEGDSG